jgi:steroid 5-alpha reductase family enzyme
MNQALTTLPIILGATTILWLISLWRRDASIVDIFWGAGFAGIVLSHWLIGTGEMPVRLALCGTLTIIWGLRLSIYLGWRNLGRGEDPRYQAIRSHYGRHFPLVSLPLVFLFQGGLIWIISLPVQLTAGSREPLSMADWAGLGLWSIGLAFEAVGDWQLARFKANPENRGKVLDRGLWAWTRHPNYFGDALVWWGLSLPVIVTDLSHNFWLLLSPLLMTWLLRRFSGVPLLEKGLHETRPGYADYVARTSPFLPWPQRGQRGGAR